MPKITKLHSLTQGNEFISNSTHSLSLNQQKILYFLITCINFSDEVFYPIEVDYKTLYNLITPEDSSTHGRKKYLYELLLSLKNQTYYIFNDDSVEMFPWFSYFKFDKNLESGTAIFQFNPLLSSHLLLQRKNFTRYSLGCFLAMSSGNAAKLYNLLNRYSYQGEVIIPLETLRQLMNFLNTHEKIDKYAEYRELQRKVLVPCIEEINQKTDIYVSFEPIKSDVDRRKIDSVRFLLHRKEEMVPAAQRFMHSEIELENDKSLINVSHGLKKVVHIVSLPD